MTSMEHRRSTERRPTVSDMRSQHRARALSGFVLGRVAGWLAAAVLLIVGIAMAFLPGLVESNLQGVADHAAYPIPPDVQRRHDALIVADWHADSLLWNRDLMERSDRGHVDVPRLEEGGVAIQMFTTVTKSPTGQNYEKNSAESFDVIAALAVIQRWPLPTWWSLTERALYQAAKLERFAEGSPDRLAIVRTAADLERVLAQRKESGAGPIAALIGAEGAHALDGELANVDVLHAAGFRMIGLHHFFDNKLGGSLHGESGAGLTEFGRAVVRRLGELEIIIDVAHSAPAVVDDVLELSDRPIVVSHTGLYGVCPTARNLSDAQMKRIAAKGGLIAVGYWDGAVCDISPSGVAAALRYAVDLVGEDCVALGSDFDGATTTAFDSSELAVLTQALIEVGMGDVQIAKVMGGNSVRFLLENLPQSLPRPFLWALDPDDDEG